jgi:cold shock protein
MASGKVKWFNNAKGYGFILPEGGGDDLFVHYSSIEMDGYKTLKAGQDVEYDLLQGPKGNHAVNIRMLNPVLADGQAPPAGTDSLGITEARERLYGSSEAPFGASAVHSEATS